MSCHAIRVKVICEKQMHARPMCVDVAFARFVMIAAHMLHDEVTPSIPRVDDIGSAHLFTMAASLALGTDHVSHSHSQPLQL
jgi:hypothetical protein